MLIETRLKQIYAEIFKEKITYFSVKVVHFILTSYMKKYSQNIVNMPSNSGI